MQAINKFLKISNGKICGPDNKPIMLKGINLGGWLMMEAYFMHAPNKAEFIFKKEFVARLGQKALEDFEVKFRKSFITENDFVLIKEMGFNCLRVPFNHKLIEAKPFKYSEKGIAYLDKVLVWARKYKMYVILDLHAAAGSQNHDWHSDSDGRAQLWISKTYQKRTYALWEFIADRYKDETWLVGYDLLNESVVDDVAIFNNFYKNVIKSIRKFDRNHILFIEGNKWATDIECLVEFDDDNYCLSIHSYEPLNFTFNFVPHLKYPLSDGKNKWDKDVMKRHLLKYKMLADKRNLPILVGEFGVNYRLGLFNEDKWLDDVLNCFKEFGFHWTYWTFKAAKNNVFPDGVYSYYENPDWIRRHGPIYGWDNYKELWPKFSKEIIKSFDTDKFQPNDRIIEILKKYAK